MTAKEDLALQILEAKLMTEIGPYEARELADRGEAVLLDVRSKESHDKGFIPGSLHIPRKELAGRLQEIPRGKVVVAYCSDLGCQSSTKATLELRKTGLDARHMIGNFAHWKEKGYPTTSATGAPTVQVTKR